MAAAKMIFAEYNKILMHFIFLWELGTFSLAGNRMKGTCNIKKIINEHSS